MLSRAQLEHVHEGLRQMLGARAPRSSRFCAVPKVPVDETVRRNAAGLSRRKRGITTLLWSH